MKKSHDKVWLVREFITVDDVSYVPVGANLMIFDVYKNQDKGGDTNMAKKVDMMTGGSLKEIDPGDKVKPVKDDVSEMIKNEVISGVPVTDANGNQLKDENGNIITRSVKTIDMDSEDLNLLNAEQVEMQKKIESMKLENQEIKQKIESIGEDDSEDKDEQVDENARLKIELKKRENEILKLKIAQLEQEKAELQSQMGNVKGFTREFDESKLDNEDEFSEKKQREKLKEPDANYGTAVKNLKDGLSRYIT